MTFVYPAAWALVALLPLLFLRRPQPPRPVRVPALFLFADLPEARPRPRARSWPLLLPLLLALGLIAAASEPLLVWAPRRAALLIDTSASMQTGDRAEEARAEAARWLGSLPSATAVDVWATAPVPRQLASDLSPRRAASRLAEISPTSAPDPPDAILAAAVARLRRDNGRVRLVTDRPAPEEWEATVVGQPEPNTAITHLDITASPFRPDERAVAIGIEHFAAAAQSTADLILRDGESGQQLFEWSGEVTPGETLTLVVPGLPAARTYRAELAPADVLAADNVASVTGPAARTLAVRVVTPEPRASASLCSLRAVECEVIAPEAYSPDLPPRPTIFHLSAPREASRDSVPARSLFLLPPPGVPYLPAEAGRASAVVDWSAEHALTRHVNFDLWQPRDAVAYRAEPPWRPLVRSAEGGVVLVAGGDAERTLVGAPLLPLRGGENVPGSIVLLNALTWLAQAPAEQAVPTGVLSATESNLWRPDPLPALTPGSGRTAREASMALGPSLLVFALVLFLADLWQRGGLRTWLTAGLAAAVATLLVLALVGPERRVPAPVQPVVLLDASASLSRADRLWMLTQLERMRLPAATPCLLFAGDLSWRQCGDRRAWEDGFVAGAKGGTNIARALGAALSTNAPDDAPLELHLFTDGWETEGDAAREWERLGRGAAPLRAHAPPPRSGAGEVSVAALRIPSVLRLPGRVRIPVVLENSGDREIAGRLRLDAGGGSTHDHDVSVPPGRHVVAARLSLPKSRESIAVRARFVPPEGSPSEHSEAASWLTHLPRARVALVAADRRDVDPLVRALERGGFHPEVHPPERAGALVEGRSPDVVVLANVPAAALPRGVAADLESAVRSGTGLLMLGGERSLGLGGFQGTPIADALPVHLKPPQRRQQRVAVVVVVDKSGSMRRQDRLVYAKAAAKAVHSRLRDTDLFGVVGFDTQPFVVVPLGYAGRHRPGTIARIDRLQAAGRTYLRPALEAAERELRAGPPADRRHIVVMSDGETGGASSVYLDLASAMHEGQGITVSTIAIGDRPNRRLLSRIARFGGGAFHHTDDARSLPDLLLADLREATREETLREKTLRPVPNRASTLLGPLARGSWPPVRGMVETTLKRDARQDLGVREDPHLPLLASRTHGRGRVAVFTSDAGSRWAAPWLRWPDYDDFWGRVLDWAAGKRDGPLARWHVAAGSRPGGTAVSVTSLRPLERPVALRTALLAPDGPGRRSLPLAATAPGHFVAAPQAEADGPVRFAVEIDEGTGPAALPTLVAQPGSETPRLGTNAPLLDALSEPGSVRPSTTRSSLRAPLAGLALVLYILLFLRRGAAT